MLCAFFLCSMRASCVHPASMHRIASSASIHMHRGFIVRMCVHKKHDACKCRRMARLDFKNCNMELVRAVH